MFCGTLRLRMLIEEYRMSGIEKNDVEEAILRALDKGIDDMENGRVVPHEQAMEIVRQGLKGYALRPMSEQEIYDILDESSRQVQEGKHKPADESLEELGRKYGILEEGKQ